jgi:hypothetical protein
MMNEQIHLNKNRAMTKITKILLAISLTAFVIGSTGILWGIGTPVGAICFGLFMISKVLEKEALLHSRELAMRHAWAEGILPAVRTKPSRSTGNYAGAKALAAVTSH